MRTRSQRSRAWRLMRALPAWSRRRKSDSADWWLPTCKAGVFGEARRLCEQVIALGNAGGLLRRGLIVGDRGDAIACQFVQVSADGMETMMSGDARILVERVEQIQAVSGAVDHG